MTIARLKTLYDKCLAQTASPSEKADLLAALNDPAHEAAIKGYIEELIAAQKPLEDVSEHSLKAMISAIIGEEKEEEQPAIVHNIHSTRKWWWTAAAVLLFAIGAGIYYIGNQSNQTKKTASISGETKGIKEVIQPGTNRAILTINNNQNIDLASDKTGINIDNTITYNDGEKIADAGQMLQLTTPRGGQYQAVLPDGSKVWLNAASSIKFPSKFNNKERRVEVRGEAYFEIVKDNARPFFIQTSKDNIAVLGTSFNINDYANEPNAKTSLIEGSIKVNDKLLKPGEAYQNGALIKTNIEQDISWKNGLFAFKSTDIATMMRQAERWYNVEVQYPQGIPGDRFSGTIPRSVSLQQFLDILKYSDIKVKINGTAVIITP